MWLILIQKWIKWISVNYLLLARRDRIGLLLQTLSSDQEIPIEQWFLLAGPATLRKESKGRESTTRDRLLFHRACASTWRLLVRRKHSATVTRTSTKKILIGKTKTLHVHHNHTFLYLSLPFFHDFDVGMPNFAFYRECKHATKFLFLNLEISLRGRRRKG